MTVKHLFPAVEPSLNLDFANSKRLDPRITFTRSSTGTYVGSNGLIKTAAANEARFDHDPTTGESLGLLVEEARTNDLKYSSYPSLWGSNIGVTVQTKAGIAPDGTFSAELVKQDTATSSHSLRQYGATPNASTYRISCFLKYSGHRYVAILCSINAGLYGCFDLVDGAASVGTITSIGNGWFYCQSINYTGSSINTLAISLTNTFSSSYGSHGASGPTYAGNGVSGIFVWGVQTEVGSFATSHIPTPATFTSRASTATYYDASGIVQTAGSNVARSNAYFPDENGIFRPAGLLLEAAGTNLVLNSVNMNGTGWGRGNGSITLSAITSPDGVNPSYAWTNTQTTGSYNYTLITVTSSTQYTFSFWYKAGSGRTAPRISLYDATNAIFFDDGPSYNTTAFPNGWYRLSCTFTSPATSTAIRVYVDRNAEEIGTLYIWGVQVETGPFHTSYIPTSGSTVTRAADVSSSSTVTRSADVASMTGTNFSSWYNQSEGTLSFTTLSKGNAFAGYLQGASTTDRIDPYQSNSYPTLVVVNSGTNVVNAGSSTPMSFIVKQQFAVGIKQGAYALAQQGAVTITGSNSTSPPTVTQMFLGRQWTPLYLNGTISRLTYYPTRLTDAQLQALTL